MERVPIDGVDLRKRCKSRFRGLRRLYYHRLACPVGGNVFTSTPDRSHDISATIISEQCTNRSRQLPLSGQRVIFHPVNLGELANVSRRVTSSSSIGNNVRCAVNDAFTLVPAPPLAVSPPPRLNLSFYGPFGGCESDRAPLAGEPHRKVGWAEPASQKREKRAGT